jgi:hypothetical protein
VTIQDYLDGTRLPLEDEELSTEFSDGYKNLYARVLSEIGEPEAYPALVVIRSLNKNSQLITLNKSPYLVYDQYLGQTISELTRIYCCATTPDDAKAFMFRMAAEAAECCGKPDIALWFACLYSHMFHLSHAYKSQETTEQQKRRHTMTAIGEVFILAHEVAHHLWRQGVFDQSLIDLLAVGLESVSEPSEEALDQMVTAYLEDLSFQYHGTDVPHAANIKTEEERLEDEILRRKLCDEFRSDRRENEAGNAKLASDPVFREEMHADFLAVQLCVRSFAEKIDFETIITAIQLVMENLTTIAFVVEHTEKLLGFEVFEHGVVVNTRKRLVRDYLEREYDLRKEESKSHNATDRNERTGHQITTATNIRYMRYVRDPITIDVASKFTSELVLERDVLGRLRSKLASRNGREMTAQAMLRAKSFRYGGSGSTAI